MSEPNECHIFADEEEDEIFRAGQVSGLPGTLLNRKAILAVSTNAKPANNETAQFE